MSATKPQNGCAISLYALNKLPSPRQPVPNDRAMWFTGDEHIHHDLPIRWKFGEYVLGHHIKMLGGHERKRSRRVKPKDWAHISTDVDAVLSVYW
ncbi:hypothetical protein RRF57_007649 [Xylaria bambusicola]|uniref:Uncharacterized protein n=1 Tax=Xylaria bambusicola TaxID=326684 RepID=A0AAN7USC7_9PEZI